MNLIQQFRKFKKGFLSHAPLVVVTISKSRLLHNVQTYQKKYPNLEIAPVLKSNAYGHGLIHVAEILEGENLPFFVLDSFFEAQTLRKGGIKTDLLVIGYTPNETLLNEKIDCAFTVTSLEQLRELSQKLTHPLRIHLKIDTGMHRQGILPEEIDGALKILEKNPNFKLEGVCSHLADADAHDTSFTLKQIRIWKGVVEDFKQIFPDVKYVHISATAGAGYTKDISGNILRLGLGLYGIDPAPESDIVLKPVLQMESVVGSVRELNQGDSVGYNCTKIIQKPSRIATIPVGYFEGVDRRLSNNGMFKINNVSCPIVGRVSMNITSIDVTDTPEAVLGTKVVVVSRESSDKNSIENIAKLSKTIPWEIFVHIPAHLFRKVVE